MAEKVLIAGANGYVGIRLMCRLAEKGVDVVALVRSSARLKIPKHLRGKVQVIEGDLLQRRSLEIIPDDIDCAYYLVHSLASRKENFFDLEEKSAQYFLDRIQNTKVKKIVYLSGLSANEPESEHMRSRHRVGEVLASGRIPVVNFKAGIIIGSGSASFEIMRDLVEKLPVMVAPKWVVSKCQPIGIHDVLVYLDRIRTVMVNESVVYELGGPDVLTYKEMLLGLAGVRKLKRWIFIVPVLTPRLSSLWLYFVTATNLYLAKRLVESLKTDAICTNDSVQKAIPHRCLSYEKMLKRTFDKIEQNHVLSSWKDAVNKNSIHLLVDSYISVPEHGCLKNVQKRTYTAPASKVVDNLWRIGGNNGWYYMNWAWKIRGWIDKLVGGVGLRRGRRSSSDLETGDALDFWRVIKADKANGKLILYAEMKLPGEAWLSWNIKEKNGATQISQVATFRPKGVFGRFYWYILWPVHLFIFKGLCDKVGCKK